MKNKLFLVAAVLAVGSLTTPFNASAKAEDSLIYSIEDGGTMNQVLENEDGEIYSIEIEEVPEFSIMRSTIPIKNKGSYKVTKSLPNQWNITYYISINSSYDISNANRLSINITQGTLKNSSLTFNKTRAIATIERKMGILSNTGSVTATVSKKNLIIK